MDPIEQGSKLQRVFPLTVLLDSNEIGHRTHYRFEGITADKERGGGDLLVPTRSANLFWGDYSLEGHEQHLIIERKTLADLYGTIGGRRDSFYEEVKRMSRARMAAVVIESSWEDVVLRQPEFTQTRPKTIVRTIMAWWARHPNVAWHFFGCRELCEVMTFRLIERYFLETLPEKERRRFRYQKAGLSSLTKSE